jgi:hypothetical protein
MSNCIPVKRTAAPGFSAKARWGSGGRLRRARRQSGVGFARRKSNQREVATATEVLKMKMNPVIGLLFRGGIPAEFDKTIIFLLTTIFGML